ncbi:MAG: response regulator [Cyanobacteria bacterium SZAS LIN-3]|nr:response regulator [Cyanobacteria bacterium SZAS LIN-3]
MSDKVHAGHQSKSSKDLFKEGFKAFKDALKGAESAFGESSSLESEAGQLIGSTALTLAELPKILFKLSQSTSVGAVITSATGTELMANNAFYALAKDSGSAGGAMHKLRKGADSQEVLTPPWTRAAKNRKAIFERLLCGDGEQAHYLDFYCQPLLAAGGEFEGAFTLIADSSHEVNRQEHLRELVAGVEAHIDDLKKASDELVQFLKSNGQTGAVVPNHLGSAVDQIESLPDASLKSVLDSSSDSGSSSDLSVVTADTYDSVQEPLHQPLTEAPSSSSSSSSSNSFINSEPSSDETDFDPALLQQVVDSASAFILDQEAAGNTSLEAAEEAGPEELWQEMSAGLAEVLNVEETEEAKIQDINMTILEEKPAKSNHIAADKNTEAVFKNPSGEPAACLVVDDIPVNQKLLVFQLKHFGMSIDTASSGSEALEMMAKNNYDIVFMDCDMPRMSGFDTTAEIRRREQASGRKVPIIGMTSHDRDGDKQKCLRSGMNEALSKGVSESELRRTIATALGVVEVVKQIDGPDHERSFDPQELEELISTFLYAMEMFVSSMQRAIDEKDSALVRELASSVSGPSRVLGLHDMNKVSQEMVRLSSSGDWPQVRLKYLKLKTVYMRCQDDLRKLCPQAFSQVSATH